MELSREKGCKSSLFVLWVFCILLSLLIVGFLIYFLFFRKKDKPRELYYTIPKAFSVNDSYLIPTWNQLMRGTCWAFATISILETQYKHQGIQYGYLKDNEYVEFSKEYYAYLLSLLCAKNKTEEICHGSSRAKNVSSSGTVQDLLIFSKKFPEVLSKIVPESACPYNLNAEDELKCPSNIETVASSNPIHFKITDFQVVTGIQKSKDLLYKVKYPVSFSISLPAQRYIFECRVGDMSNETSDTYKQCHGKVFPCPYDASQYCFYQDFPFAKPKKASMISHNPGSLTYAVGHAMILVGYNDEFVEPLPINTTLRPLAKGGFILRNSWGSRGHSIDYLMGRISYEQEQMICPNSDDVFHWVPGKPDCLKSVPAIIPGTEPSISKCSDVKQNRGGKIIIGPTLLQCYNETHCAKGHYYVLKGQLNSGEEPETVVSQSDVVLGVLIDLNTKKEEIIESLPFEHLYWAFKPVDELENDPTHCGHVFYSYDSIDEMMGSMGPRAPTFRTAAIKVKFAKESYARSKQKYDYSYVLRSTGNYSRMVGSDPFVPPSEL